MLPHQSLWWLFLSLSSFLNTMHDHCTALHCTARTSLINLLLLFSFLSSMLILSSLPSLFSPFSLSSLFHSHSCLSLFSPLFSLLSPVTVIGKNISFLAASASRAAIHKTFAVHENLADITAKTGSQCILGRPLSPYLSFSPSLSITISLCVCIHLILLHFLNWTWRTLLHSNTHTHTHTHTVKHTLSHIP